MNVSIFGLGSVGCVSATCLAREGHKVVGVDINPDKVALVASGRSPVVEPGLSEQLAQAVLSGSLTATAEAVEGVCSTDISLVCVGTPSLDSGGLDLSQVSRVCDEIGRGMRVKSGRHTVTLRSTMLPGSTRQILIPRLEASSGRQAGRDFGVCYNPEFLREGTALQDFYEPPRTVIGELDAASGDWLVKLYGNVKAPLVRTDLAIAEMLKYADNAFHGLKVAFANEIGNVCKALGVDGYEVMRLFALDKKLNLSPVYLRPGFAFGGSCLPKDLRALTHRATQEGLEVPLLRAILASNDRQKRVALEAVRRAGCNKVGVLGLSFKQDTDDLRESPSVELVETLLGKGYGVKVYDPSVSLPALIGKNRAYIERELPHLSRLLCQSLDELLDYAEVLVVTTRNAEFPQVAGRLRPDQKLLDFVRISESIPSLNGRYEGMCW